MRKLLVVACLLVLSIGSHHHARAMTLVIGSISVNPSGEMADWLPFANYLARELAADGITQGKVVVARSEQEMAELIRSGKVDLYIDSPIIALEVASMAGSRVMARRWKKGAPTYRSVIFARTDSDIGSLADLKGKVVAFQAQYSSSGYLLPWLELRRAGLLTERLSSPTAKPSPDAVGYLFSGADRNTVAWVLYGRVVAGATSNDDFARIRKSQRKNLAVIAETEEMPRHIVTYRRDLAPALVTRIKSILLSMDETESGRRALVEFERSSKFDEVTPEILAAITRYHEALAAARSAR